MTQRQAVLDQFSIAEMSADDPLVVCACGRTFDAMLTFADAWAHLVAMHYTRPGAQVYASRGGERLVAFALQNHEVA